MKDIWHVNGQSWDDELPKDTVDRFLAWCVELPRLAEITIPRSYFSGPFQHLELHMFGDSSQDAFSAVGFLRAQVTCTSGEIITELAFVLSKARVAPMKVMTVPKFELPIALLAARLKREICRALTVTVDKVFMWSDSTIVLQWINSTTNTPSALQIVLVKSWRTRALTNGTTSPLVIILQMLARVVCPLKFCNQVAG